MENPYMLLTELPLLFTFRQWPYSHWSYDSNIGVTLLNALQTLCSSHQLFHCSHEDVCWLLTLLLSSWMLSSWGSYLWILQINSSLNPCTLQLPIHFIAYLALYWFAGFCVVHWPSLECKFHANWDQICFCSLPSALHIACHILNRCLMRIWKKWTQWAYFGKLTGVIILFQWHFYFHSLWKKLSSFLYPKLVLIYNFSQFFFFFF